MIPTARLRNELPWAPIVLTTSTSCAAPTPRSTLSAVSANARTPAAMEGAPRSGKRAS
jgi:hypothetical protein